jgi:ribosomal protein S18 acetylase RimI-like enzyme
LTNISVQGPYLNQASLCEPILRALPEWFGSETSNAQYLKDINTLPTWVAFDDHEMVGFLTIKEHTPYAAEILIMGVSPNMHRKGVGRRLVFEAEKDLRQRGIEYLQVKTLSSIDSYEPYARTRNFYFAVGFRPLEEFGELWEAGNPCLQMVKSLADKAA